MGFGEFLSFLLLLAKFLLSFPRALHPRGRNEASLGFCGNSSLKSRFGLSWATENKENLIFWLFTFFFFEPDPSSLQRYPLWGFIPYFSSREIIKKTQVLPCFRSKRSILHTSQQLSGKHLNLQAVPKLPGSWQHTGTPLERRFPGNNRDFSFVWGGCGSKLF